VIDEGVTGFVVDDAEQAVQAVKRLGELDRRRVRERFEERFTAGRMAADYLLHYQSLVNDASPEGRRHRFFAAEANADSRHLTPPHVISRLNETDPAIGPTQALSEEFQVGCLGTELDSKS
jgi:hypothetical protein